MEWVWRGQSNKGMVINQSSLCLMGLPNKGTGLLNCAGACRSHPQRGCPFCLQVSGVLWMGGWLRGWWVRSKQEPVSGVLLLGCVVWPLHSAWNLEGVMVRDWNRQLCGVLLLASVSVVLFLLSRTACVKTQDTWYFFFPLVFYSLLQTLGHTHNSCSAYTVDNTRTSDIPWKPTQSRGISAHTSSLTLKMPPAASQLSKWPTEAKNENLLGSLSVGTAFLFSVQSQPCWALLRLQLLLSDMHPRRQVAAPRTLVESLQANALASRKWRVRVWPAFHFPLSNLPCCPGIPLKSRQTTQVPSPVLSMLLTRTFSSKLKKQIRPEARWRGWGWANRWEPWPCD